MNNIDIYKFARPQLESRDFTDAVRKKNFVTTFEQTIGTILPPRGITRVPKYRMRLNVYPDQELVSCVVYFADEEGTPTIDTIEDFEKIAASVKENPPFVVEPTLVEDGFFTLYFTWCSEAGFNMIQRL